LSPDADQRRRSAGGNEVRIRGAAHLREIRNRLATCVLGKESGAPRAAFLLKDAGFFAKSCSRQESAMERILVPIIILLGITAAHAQTGVQTNGALNASGTGAVAAPCTASGLSFGGTAANISAGAATALAGCANVQLNGPATSTLPAGGSTLNAGTGTAATGQFGAVGSISTPAATNPQGALQLPGEASNNATQAPSATTSAAGGASAGGGLFSGTLCGPTIATNSGVSNPAGLFGGVSAGGC
jgi:hypothetical protein